MAKTTTTVKEINELFPNLCANKDAYIKILEEYVDMHCEQIQDWKDFIDVINKKWKDAMKSLIVENV